MKILLTILRFLGIVDDPVSMYRHVPVEAWEKQRNPMWQRCMILRTVIDGDEVIIEDIQSDLEVFDGASRAVEIAVNGEYQVSWSFPLPESWEPRPRLPRWLSELLDQSWKGLKEVCVSG